MIPFDFDYYKPSTITEAVQTFQDLSQQGKRTIFYSGGTEFITFSRTNKMVADAVIDIKGIPECHVLGHHDDQLVIGAAVSLNKISESKLFPLLGNTVKQIADHTSRNKITLGGNLNSGLIYREGILPFLLTETTVNIAGPDGEAIVPLEEVFNNAWKIVPGQFLIQIFIDKAYTDLPFVSLKKMKVSKVGYPIVTIAAIVKNQQIRAAFSGVCEYPFRSTQIEAVLNDASLTASERIDKAVSLLPAPIIDDLQASAAYREFVLKNTLLETLETLEAAQE